MNPNYRDFYQKSLIPVGKRDQLALNERNKTLHSNLKHNTHWLIAIEAECVQTPNEYYHWKVLIYPSNCEASFHWKNAYYTSPLMDSLNQALELTRIYESYCIKDELHSTNLQEKIS